MSRTTAGKDKFSLLQDIAESKFCNIIVQVARAPYDLYGTVTLYVSDYTANDAFYNYTWDGMGNLPGHGGGDPYGYTEAESAGRFLPRQWRAGWRNRPVPGRSRTLTTQALATVARTYRNQQRWEPAIAVYRQALQREPNNPDLRPWVS